MITDLVLMRHAESEGNIANRNLLKGDVALKERLIQTSPSLYRLTPRGRTQALATGHFIGNEFVEFDHCLCSDLVRTIETAVLLSEGSGDASLFRDVEWQLTPLLRERSWGRVERTADLDLHHQWMLEREREDFLTWIPPDGEHFTTTLLRAKMFLSLADSLGGRILAVTSNQMIMTIDALIRCYTALDAEGAGFGVSFPHNCQLIHYAARKAGVLPLTGALEHVFTHVRCTSEEKNLEFGEWSPITRRKYRIGELKELLNMEAEACRSEIAAI